MNSKDATAVPVPSLILQSGSVPFARPRAGLSTTSFAVWLALHCVLGILICHHFMAVAKVHLVATLLVGFAWARLGQDAERLGCLILYVAGSEVFWRMTGCDTYLGWEGAKYVVALLCLCRMASERRRLQFLPLFYFLLLLPSLAAIDFDANEKWFEGVRFNLSGPFALACAALCFGGRSIKPAEGQRLFASLLGPIVGVGAIAAYSMGNAEVIRWTGQSNSLTSGNGAPNQVSAALGLGALVAFLWAHMPALSFKLRLLLNALLVALMTQATLTFSRGGVYMAIVAAVAGLLGSVGRPGGGRMRYAILGSLLVFATLCCAVVLPALDKFTGGALTARYEKEGLSGRDELMREDIELFMAHPFLGVGAGASETERVLELGGRGDAPHTEYTRLLAEHGVLGICSLAVLLAMVLRGVARTRTFWPRLVSTSLAVWAFLFFAVNAFRLALPGVAIALVLAGMSDETGQPQVAYSKSSLNRTG